MSDDIIEAIIKDSEPEVKKKQKSHKEDVYEKLKPVEPEIKDGYKKFSEVFGFKPPSGIDHAVPVFDDEDWPEEVRSFIPAEDAEHVWPEKETEWFVVGLAHGDRSFLTGPKGSGKSSMPTQVAAKLRIPVMRVNCRADMESSALFGQPSIEDGTLEWIPGPAEVLGKSGGILIVDEMTAAPAGISMAMQWMLEKDGKIFLPDKPSDSGEKFIDPHPWFRVCATDNTVGQGDTTGTYVGAQVQNEATIDRFSLTINMDYMPKSQEIKVIKSRVPGLPEQVYKDMVGLAQLVRKSYNQDQIQSTMSPRSLVNWAEKTKYYGDVMVALRLAYFDKLTEDDQKEVNEYIYKIFAKKMK